MQTTGSGDASYLPEKSKVQTAGEKTYQQLAVYEKVPHFIENTPIAKLYLVLLMIVYSISVYSKGKNGMEQSDVVLIIFFSIFLILSIIFLEVVTFVYRGLLKEADVHSGVLSLSITLFKKYFLPIIIALVLFVIVSFIFYYAGKFIVLLLSISNVLIK